MKSPRLFAIAIVTLATAAFAITGSEDKPRQKVVVSASASENAALKKEVRRLEERVAALEKRLAALESHPRQAPNIITNFQFTLPPRSGVPGSPKGVLTPRGTMPPESVSPKNWGGAEANGWKFHYLPLQYQGAN